MFWVKQFRTLHSVFKILKAELFSLYRKSSKKTRTFPHKSYVSHISPIHVKCTLYIVQHMNRSMCVQGRLDVKVALIVCIFFCLLQI